MDEALIVFLDRDGVISRDVPGGCTRRWTDFRFLPGAREALGLLNQAGARVFVVSNQAGVGQGLISPSDLAEMDRRMRDSVEAAGGLIEGSFYCPHLAADGCACRKPATGLLEQAAREHGLDPLRSRGWLVGDRESDIECGARAGLATVLVLSGHTVCRSETGGWEKRPDHVAADLLGAIDYII